MRLSWKKTEAEGLTRKKLKSWGLFGVRKHGKGRGWVQSKGTEHMRVITYWRDFDHKVGDEMPR